MISENEILQELFFKKSQKKVSSCVAIGKNRFEISFYRCLRKKKVLMDLLYDEVEFVKNKNFVFKLESINYYTKEAKFEIEILAKRKDKNAKF